MKKLVGSLVLLVWTALCGAQNIPMDYSYCGYNLSATDIPIAINKVYVSPEGDHDAQRIQCAIDYVSSLKPDRKTGLRGAVLLKQGTYVLDDALRISVSGVVLRGERKAETILKKVGADRGALIYIEGAADRKLLDTLQVTDDYVAAGALSLHVNKPVGVGQRVLVVRPSTQQWINDLQCNVFGGGKELGYWGWHPGDVDLQWNRSVAMAANNCITLDAPIATALDKKYGGGQVIIYQWPGVVEHVGVENLTLVSDYQHDRLKDEDHCWDGVAISRAMNCWVRMTNFKHFAGSAVIVNRDASQITVEDCSSLHPVSEIGGMRRRTFLTFGQLCLFQRCYSEAGINDFSAGFIAPGPNAFVQCESYGSLGFSGSISSWAPGLLFDVVSIDGNDLIFKNLGLEKYGAGWNTANSTLWQCSASGIECFSPTNDAPNVCIGCWAQFQGNGLFLQPNEHVKPYSLFESLLSKRLGKDVSSRCRVLVRGGDASSSPTIDEAQTFAQEALLPRTTMQMWIDSAKFAVDDNMNKHMVDGATLWKKQAKRYLVDMQTGKHTYTVEHGQLLFDNALMAGRRHQTPWWNGRLRYSALPKATYALTRFVPGWEGMGVTDRVDSVVAEMERTQTILFNQNYGLWYDRRRDDHERVRRKNGDVWGPFYEQPFARSGVSTAWDGLSKYDLNRLNSWYYKRLNDFATKGSPKGLLLLNQHYFQHNILEAGAHWVDCPWRSANNINNSGFLEPVPFTGDKRIFTADAFYDVSHPVRRALHRSYIRATLDAFRNQPNVIHSIGEEFTGPLHFVQFWLDCIQEWEQETGLHPLVALNTTKDVQDAILNDSVRSKVVNIIAVEQWYYHDKGLYAPPGGVNMAPRQYARKIKAGSVGFDNVYQTVSEYRTRYPEKCVMYFGPRYPQMAWAVFMAGGSCAELPITNKTLLADAVGMKPSHPQKDVYVLSGDKGYIVFHASDNPTQISLSANDAYVAFQLDETGKLNKKLGKIKTTLSLQNKGVFWLRKQ